MSASTSADRKKQLETFLQQTFQSNINNSRLHEAILGNFNPPEISKNLPTPLQILAKVKELLALDEELVKLGGESIINKKAIENTALHLAIKHGLIDVALEILKHPQVDVNLVDNRSLSALQMACMLRNDTLINELLNKNAKQDLDSKDIYLIPANIYTFQATEEDIRKIINVAKYQIKDIDRDGRVVFKYGIPFAESPDNPLLHILLPKPEIDIYADFLIFYMQPLLRNLGWVNGENLNKLNEASAHLRSEDTFRHSCIIGSPLFFEARNKIAPNPQILARLKYTSSSTATAATNQKQQTDYKSASSKSGETSIAKEGYFSKQQQPASGAAAASSYRHDSEPQKPSDVPAAGSYYHGSAPDNKQKKSKGKYG